MNKYTIFDNQKETAKMILNSINLGNKKIHLVAPTQSGKTGTIVHLANIMSDSNFILSSGMMENHLFNQNSQIAQMFANNIKAVKVHDLLKEPNPKQVVRDLSIDIVVFDESHYGIGKESRLDKLINELSSSCPNLTIIWIGATGYQLVDSDEIDDTIQMVVPNNYYGVSSILSSNLFFDNNSFKYLLDADSNLRKKAKVDYGVIINEEFKTVLNHLKSFKEGLGIMRTNTQESAQVIKRTLNNGFPYAKVIVATSSTGIQSSVNDAKMISRNKRVILIVVQGLKAGVDLGEAKSRVRFVIETYKTCASVSQGLVGRICGYHENRDCIVIADKSSLELQSAYEKDFRVINPEFLGKLFGVQTKRLATNHKYYSKYNYKSNMYYIGDVHRVKSISEINESMFKDYNPLYAEKVKKIMLGMIAKDGKYILRTDDNPSKTDRINTIQRGKFSDESQFENYYKRFSEDKINFSSIFHRFAKTSEFRRRGGLKGGVSNGQYAGEIKVGILYDNLKGVFYISVRDKEMTRHEKIVNTINKTIFNN